MIQQLFGGRISHLNAILNAISTIGVRHLDRKIRGDRRALGGQASSASRLLDCEGRLEDEEEQLRLWDVQRRCFAFCFAWLVLSYSINMYK